MTERGNMAKPLIGVTADYEEAGEFKSRIENEGRYLLREKYVSAVFDHGGTPVILSYHDESVIEKLDGVLFTGGNFDIPPQLSGIKNPTLARKVKPYRTEYELAVFRKAVALKMPMLGICGGMQLMAVGAGGKLIGDIALEVENALRHEQGGPRNKPSHEVTVKKNTLLFALTGCEFLEVNSTHHQAVAEPGNASVSAFAPDGVIEAIELPGHPFALGVEWHPELLYENHPSHASIFEGFIKACLEYAGGNSSRRVN